MCCNTISIQGKIILAGGGTEKDSHPIDQHFASWLKPNEKILYLPIALQGIRSFADCQSWFQSIFHPLNITHIEMWTDLSSHSAEELSEFSAIYIGGGNTYSLMAQLIESNFDQHLILYAMQGGIIYGGSAGAAILGKDIRTIAHIDHNKIGLRETNGLNLVNDHAVWVHYQHQDDPLIFEYCRKFSQFVIAISERSGVIVNHSQIFSSGYEPAFKFGPSAKTTLPDYINTQNIT